MPKLTTNMKQWLCELFDNEIDDTLATAENEHLWALGSDTNEEAAQHEHYADEHKDYAQILMSMRKTVIEMEAIESI